jgi:hypothetical protein
MAGLQAWGRETFADESNSCSAAFFYPLGIGNGIGIAIEFLAGFSDPDPDPDPESDFHGSVVWGAA